MLEMMVMYMDMDGILRCYASGDVETNKELDELKSVASDMLDKYIVGKPYPSLIHLSEFSMSIEIVD